MIVFPESINELPKENPSEALDIAENYIKYMCQRIDWAMGNVTKTSARRACPTRRCTFC